MNQITSFNSFDSVLNDAINQKLHKKLDKLEQTIIDKCSPEHHSYIKELISEHRYKIRSTLKISMVRKTRCKKDISPHTRCMARIGLGTQCSRSKMENSEFCKSHFISLPYGRIDSPEIIDQKVTKKRGRRSKVDKGFTIEDLDMNKYIQAIVININGDTYLLDQNNILFKHNNLNEIVGFLNEDKVEWY